MIKKNLKRERKQRKNKTSKKTKKERYHGSRSRAVMYTWGGMGMITPLPTFQSVIRSADNYTPEYPLGQERSRDE